MKTDRRPLIRLALDLNTVSCSKPQPDTVVHIQKPHAGALLALMAALILLVEECAHRLHRHTQPGVRPHDLNKVRPAVAPNLNLALPVHILDTVIDRIFQKRLDNQLHRTAF